MDAPAPTSRRHEGVDPRSSILDPRSSASRGARLTREGRYWLVATALLLVIGVMKNINLVTLLGYVLLAVPALNLLATGRRLRRLRARRRLGDLIFAGAPCDVEVGLTNPARRACLAVRLEERGPLAGPGPALAWFSERLPGGATRSFRGQVLAPRRGRHVWGPVVARSGHPFGLIRRGVELVPAQEVIVLPPVGWLHRGLLRRHLRGADPRAARVRRQVWRHLTAQAEFHGLRAFRPGDSPKAIHWRTTARRGEWMVREFEDVPGENLVLIFDPTSPAPAGGDAGPDPAGGFESALSLAATVCWEWCRRKGDQLILAAAGPQPRVVPGATGPEHARRVLECLAVQEPAPPADPRPLLDLLKAAALPHAAVVLVSAGPTALAEPLARALRRPVTCLDPAAAVELDLYEPPATSSAPAPGHPLTT
jgi:uncharacterized protein (DUF58 family)